MRSLSVITAAVLFIFASVLHAVPVTYTGDSISGAVGSGNVTATFDFTTTLTAGATLTEADIASWSMSAAGRTIDSSAFSYFEAEFNIGAALLPTSWYFVAEQDLESGPAPESIASWRPPVSSTSIVSTQDFIFLDDTEPNDPAASGTFSWNSNSPGIFTAVPEPSAYLYLGLVGLAVMGWKKRNTGI